MFSFNKTEMFPLYCNKCYRQRKLEALTLDFYISTICKHVICDICLSNNKNIDNAAAGAAATIKKSSASTGKCPLCQCDFHARAISKELPAELVTYFDDPMRLVKRYRDICKFQAIQNELLNIHLTTHCEKKRSDLKRKRDAFQKIITKLENLIVGERERIAKLSSYIDWHERYKQRRPHANDSSIRPNTPYIIKVDDDDDENDAKAVDEKELCHPDSGVGSKTTSVFSFMK